MYSGWQIQKNVNSVQGSIEAALSKIFGKKIKITGAGRTDAGVHAENQIANFKVGSLPVPLGQVKHALNGMLKEGTTIKSISKVEDAFHARYSAKSRTYLYSISKQKRSIDRRQFYHPRFRFNIALVKKGARKLVGLHDFINLSVATGEKSTICDLKSIRFTETPKSIFITFSANRFLHKMVRIMVGTLLEIGRGKVPLLYLDQVFGGKLKTKVAVTAPAQGLRLIKIGF